VKIVLPRLPDCQPVQRHGTVQPGQPCLVAAERERKDMAIDLGKTVERPRRLLSSGAALPTRTSEDAVLAEGLPEGTWSNPSHGFVRRELEFSSL
jgi:hypothetical protein